MERKNKSHEDINKINVNCIRYEILGNLGADPDLLTYTNRPSSKEEKNKNKSHEKN